MYTILGATGNIGRKIVDILSKDKEDIRMVGRSADRLHQKILSSEHVHSSVGDLLDTEFLAKALTGSDAVFTLIPPNGKADNFITYADRIGESIARALKISKVKHVVNLSSIGAELSEKTGPIVGLHNQENRLNSIKGLNVLHLRPAYFMENLLMNIDLIKSRKIAGSAIREDISMPMIATKDIADFAAMQLRRHSFLGTSVAYLLGPRDLTLKEALSIIGGKIGQPDLGYVTFTYEEAEKWLQSAGLSPDMSRTYIEMSRAFNEGRITRNLVRTQENSTATSFEKFCDDVFVPFYAQKKAA